ncbi:MAG: ABC transporter ATP-binding protein [Desulfuromonas sp.]|nr:MAG: ABC transporter ATP-binding protein [Desulfuromonas sp.]
MATLLDVHNLTTHFFTQRCLIEAVRGIDFHIDEGETLALVGESGCGKSMTALSLLRLIPPPGRIVEGEIIYRGQDLLQLPEKEMLRIRGNQIGMIFQEPMTSLNPVLRIGEQIAEVLRLHRGLGDKEARDAATDLLQQVGISSPRQRLADFPHQLSGGMRQRVMIAMALACNPGLLIADEPTTALDVTIQAQILDLLARLKQERSMATLLITHDLGLVAQYADRVTIMYAGLVVESAPTPLLFENPQHPYTRGLLGCIPKLGERRERLQSIDTRVLHAGPDEQGESFFDRCPPLYAPRQNDLPPLVEIATGHHVRRWQE